MAEQQQQPAQMNDRLAASIATAVADAVVKVQERINPIEDRKASLTSSLNPSGKPKPKLRRKVYFCGAELREKFSTPEEINALNAIDFTGDFHRKLWQVREANVGGSDTAALFINIPCKTIDQRMDLPNSLLAVLSEIQAERAQQLKARQ
jgi:hypothetical protein